MNKILHTQVKEEGVQLGDYPSLHSPLEPNMQITMGDLHGNALKLMRILIQFHIFNLSKEAYHKLVAIYELESQDVTVEVKKAFDDIIAQAQVNILPPGFFLRFIGDELCDRGSNDYFILKLIEKIGVSNVPFEILLSNHGYEFLKTYLQGLRETHSYMEQTSFGVSLAALRYLMNKKVVLEDEIFDIVEKHYLPHVKLFGCTIHTITKKQEAVTVYMHAPNPFSHVKKVADCLGVPYEDATSPALMETIVACNKAFQKILKDRTLDHLFEHLSSFEQEQHPIFQLIWERTTPTLPPIFHFDLYVVHGHDGCGNVHPSLRGRVFNLDNICGKGPNLFAPFDNSVLISTVIS